MDIKLCEVATGLGTGYVRLPRKPLAGIEKERVQTIIDLAMSNRPTISDYKNIL